VQFRIELLQFGADEGKKVVAIEMRFGAFGKGTAFPWRSSDA
jgi:hypothetical protein